MIKFKIENFGLRENDSWELEKGNMYLFSGKARKGKSTILKIFQSLITASDTTPKAITNGKDEAKAELLNWTTEKGEQIEVKRISKTGEKDSYVMKKDGERVKTVTELRNVFNYQDFNAVEFVGLGTHQEGRDKQREILLSLFSDKDKESFFDFEDDEAKIVKLRKDNKKLLASAKTLRKNSTLSDADKKVLTNKEAAQNLKTTLEKEINEVELTKEKSKNLTNFISTFNSNINSAKEGLEADFVVQLEEIRSKVESKYQDELKALPSVDEDSINEKKTRVEKGIALLDTIKTLEIKESKLNDYLKEVETLTKTVNKDEADLEKIRQDRNEFMKSINLPVEGLIIGSREEGLFYDLDGVIYEFNEKQLAMSLIYEITIKIMAEVNKKSGILVVGNPGHFDNDTKQIIAKFAKDNDLLILMDEVTESEEIELVIVEVNETTTKSTPKKTPPHTKPKVEKKPKVKVEPKADEEPLLF